MICTEVDSYFYRLCHEQLMISWVITLTDDVKVYGDYDRPGLPNPWIRLTEHCQKNNVWPKKSRTLYVWGREESFL